MEGGEGEGRGVGVRIEEEDWTGCWRKIDKGRKEVRTQRDREREVGNDEGKGGENNGVREG